MNLKNAGLVNISTLGWMSVVGSNVSMKTVAYKLKGVKSWDMRL